MAGSTPTIFRGDVTLSFISSAGNKRNSSMVAGTPDGDVTLNLLGGRGSYNSMLDQTADCLDTTTNVTQMLHEEHSCLEGSEIYNRFAEIFESNDRSTQMFDLLSAYSTTLCDKTNISKSLIRNTTTGRHRLAGMIELHSNLRSEMFTWKLTESLLRDLVDSELRHDTEEEMVTDVDSQMVTTDQQHMEEFFAKNDKLRRCQIVIDWLENINSEDVLDNFYSKVDFFTDKTSNMWENSLHIKKNGGPKSKGLVAELDPDAPYRTGAKLSALDQEDDDRLLRYLFSLIRAGKIDEAQQLCVRCGQAWRAATLEGWRLSHDPNFTSSDDQPLDMIGNQYRDIWKSTCWNMSQEEMYSLHERAIYASLSGNLEHVLPVCDNWSDALWAHLKVLVDIELEQHLRLHSTCSDHQVADLPAAYWARATHLPQVFKELEASHKDGVREQSQLFFNKIQKHVILNDFEGLVNVMLETQRGTSLSPHLLRFMAHFILFLRSLDKVAIDEAMCEIVEEYIKYLVHSKQYNLVAQYCAVLPKESQLITYALFMEGIIESEERSAVLERGRKAGLDMFTITRIVTENSVFKLTELVDVNTSGNEILQSNKKSEIDAIVSSLDWLLYNPKQLMDAIHQCNAQMRIFLALKQYERVREVFSKLPSDCVAQCMKLGNIEENSLVKEYICFKTYLEAMQSFDDWFQHLHQAPVKPVNVTSRHFADNVAYEQKLKQYEQDTRRWENALDATTKHTVEQLQAVLTFAGGWMQDMTPSGEGSSREESPNTTTSSAAASEGQQEGADGLQARQEQMKRLRELCVPEIVTLLHKILEETEQYQECALLADLIQSEKYQLYQTFAPNDLDRVMTSLHQCSKLMK